VTLPFGSGNDASRYFGWGTLAANKHLQSLHQICTEIVANAIIDRLDIWNVSIECSDIFRVGEGQADKSLKPKASESYDFQMCNYLSMGNESKIGYSVEQNRTSSRCCNYACYTVQCLSNFFCCCCKPELESLPLIDLIDYTSVSKQKH